MATEKELWYDCWFKSWAEHYNDEPPEHPCVLLLCTEHLLWTISQNGHLFEEFADLVESCGFLWENVDHVTASFCVVGNDALNDAYRDYFEWRWILKLIQPAYIDLYQEVFERFAKHPNELHDIEPRDFEVLLDAIFRNNGFRSELGPGQGDGGVDLRLYSNDVVSEALTLVQVKRYAEHRPIRIEAVQALSAAVHDENANRGLFITTSRFLSSARKFAERQNRRIALAISTDVARWADMAVTRILRDKSTLVSTEHLRRLLSNKPASLEGTVYHAVTGYDMIRNKFAIVLRATPGAALLMELRTRIVTGNVHIGTEAARLDDTAFANLSACNVFRARAMRSEDGSVKLWGGRELYLPWDGNPVHFDHFD